MTKHDEVRQILYENGFKFKDGRTALDMTDEEVETFVVEFINRLSKIVQPVRIAMQNLVVTMVKTTTDMQNLGHMLEEAERRKL